MAQKTGLFRSEKRPVFPFFHLFAPLFLSVSLLLRRTADAYYTTTRNIRELQPAHPSSVHTLYYTTTRNIRELQLTSIHTSKALIIPQQETSGNYNIGTSAGRQPAYYTTTRNIRELQQSPQVPIRIPIIPQQETSGNYNWTA